MLTICNLQSPICNGAEPVGSTYQNSQSLTFANTQTLASNLLAGAGVTLTFGSNGVCTISGIIETTTSNGLLALINLKNGTVAFQTNGALLANGPTTWNFTTGVTGSVSGAVMTIGINISTNGFTDAGVTNGFTSTNYANTLINAASNLLYGLLNKTITVQTNGATLATGPTTWNFTTGLTGSVSGAVMTVGVNASGGGTQTNLWIQSNGVLGAISSTLNFSNGIGTTVSVYSNNGVASITVNVPSVTSSMNQTNFVLNTAYTNSGTTPVTLCGTWFRVPAAVAGVAEMDLMVTYAGAAYVKIPITALQTIITVGVTDAETNTFCYIVTNQCGYYFTNSSTGVGNSAGIVAGTGQITTDGGGATGATGAQGPAGTGGIATGSGLGTNTTLFAPTLLLSNYAGSASTSITNGASLSSNVSVYVFSSGFGLNQTLGIPTNSNFYNGQTWMITIGSEGTNWLNLTPTNFSAPTADKIYHSTNIVLTPGHSVTIQKQGTNFNIVAGLPTQEIGEITGFHRNFGPNCTNTCSFFVACNGQVLNDPASPFNGLTMPNIITGGQFLRGNTVSGGTGGNPDHTHTIDLATAAVGTTSGADFSAPNAQNYVTGFSDQGSSLPPYMDVVWIMRVK